MGHDITPFLQKQGWKVRKVRTKMVKHPTKEGVKIPVGKAPHSFVRIHTFGDAKAWFHISLEHCADGWKALISWRALGRDCLLLSFIMSNALDAAAQVEAKLKVYETQARLGWVP